MGMRLQDIIGGTILSSGDKISGQSRVTTRLSLACVASVPVRSERNSGSAY